MMRKYGLFILIVLLGFTLAMVGGAGLVKASLKLGTTNGVQPITEWRTEFVEQTGDVGSHASIAFDSYDGTPWVSYYDADNTALKVAHYTGSGGNCGYGNEWFCETVDNTGSVGTYSSINVYREPVSPHNRYIGVAYYDATNGALKFAEYGPSSWNIVTVQDANYVDAPSIGQYTSMRYNDGGVPLIAYYVNSSMFDDELDYAYRVTNGGNCGGGDAAEKWYCISVDNGDHVGQYTSLDYSPYFGVYIAYYDGGNGKLKYAHPGGVICGPAYTWDCHSLDGTADPDVGKFVSLHVPDYAGDEMQFAYYDATFGKLKYAKQVDAGTGNCGPSNGFQCDFIESIGTALSQAGITLVMDSEGYPIIAYMDVSNSLGRPTLKVARPVGAIGLLNGNCGHEIFPDWRCYTIDSGSLHQEEAEYASIAIDPNGLAAIAYSELVSGPSYNWYNLKIAKQREALFLPVVMK